MMLAVWHDDYEWYVARTAEEARVAQMKLAGEDAGSYDFEKVPYWKTIAIFRDDARQGEPRRYWAWVWILINGSGFLAGTEC